MKIIFMLLFGCFGVMAQAPGSEASPTLQALLGEVHQLRLAIERSNQMAPRIQIAV